MKEIMKQFTFKLKTQVLKGEKILIPKIEWCKI